MRDPATAGLPGRDAATAGLNGIFFGATRSIIRVGFYEVRAPRLLLIRGFGRRESASTSNIYSGFSTLVDIFF